MAGKAKAIQFHDSASMLEKFEQLKIPYFAIWHDQQLMFPQDEYDDIETATSVLASYLETLEDSPAIYTLRIYKTLPDTGLDNKSKYYGSWNFRLLEPEAIGRNWHGDQRHLQMVGYPGSNNNELLAEIKAMRLAMEQDRASREEEQSESKLGWIGELLENENVMNLLGNIIPAFFNKGQPNNNQSQQISMQQYQPGMQQGGIAGVPTNDEFDRAIEFLEQKDEKFKEYIIQLAHLALNNPKKFDSFVGLVKMML